MSEEAVKEIDDYMNAPTSMVDFSGNLIKNLADIRSTKYSLFCLTWNPLPNDKK